MNLKKKKQMWTCWRRGFAKLIPLTGVSGPLRGEQGNSWESAAHWMGGGCRPHTLAPCLCFWVCYLAFQRVSCVHVRKSWKPVHSNHLVSTAHSLYMYCIFLTRWSVIPRIERTSNCTHSFLPFRWGRLNTYSVNEWCSVVDEEAKSVVESQRVNWK